MKNLGRFFIDGAWVAPARAHEFPVVSPATEERVATISLGGPEDVDRAVTAATKAFPVFAETPVKERLELLERICELYEARLDEIADAISLEMGAPRTLARTAQARAGLIHLKEAARVLSHFQFEEQKGSTLMRKEAIGVCGLITPWNWPMNQVAAKVGPALAAGCTMVLKPSEFAPLSACLFAEILDAARVPPGVFNLVNGDGPSAGAALARHPDVAMVSFTGSTRGGIAVAEAAAPSVKRVTQELGGKSAHILLEDAELQAAVEQGAQACFRNSGQSCNAPTRMLVPREKMPEAGRIAAHVADGMRTGDPALEKTQLGPLVNRRQFERVQALISRGMEEGAELVAGGPGRPGHLERGYFVRPTVFAEVDNAMTIAREEIFGPVLCIIPYTDEAEAIAIANDTPYGLSGYVSSGDAERARRIARQIRAGNVHINGARIDFSACFGGYKQSGNGREWGQAGFEEYLELKAVFGFGG